MTNIPTLQELYADIITDLNTEFGIVINPFGKSFLRAWAAVQALVLKLKYLLNGNLQKNIWIDTAEPVAVGGTLERFGFTKLKRLPYPATQGRYTATVAGTIGAIIPALTQYKSDDSSLNPGHLYILDTAYIMPGSTGTITIRSLDAGTGALLAIADTLTATSPIINVNGGVVVASIAVSPIEAETIEEYRAKGIQAYQLSPQGGAPTDYRLWGSDAAGVKQIYPYAYSGHANEINIFVEAIAADSTDGHGTPTGTILTDVAADIQTDPDTGIGRKPLGVFLVHTLAIVALPVDITIDSGGTITAGQETTITQAITEATALIRPFIAGVDNAATRNDTISEFGIGGVIINAVGSVIIASILLEVDGPVTSYNFDNGEIPYINSVTYV